MSAICSHRACECEKKSGSLLMSQSASARVSPIVLPLVLAGVLLGMFKIKGAC